MNFSKFRIDAPDKVSLKDFDASDTLKMSEEDVQRHMPDLEKRLQQLQELLYASAKHGVLIALQGLDTAGKDGVIKHVMTSVNPAGCVVTGFKAPTQEELAHDFLWRIHKHTPAKGMIAIFNRSHYEDVLAARVHHLVPSEVWKERFAQINEFEQLLAAQPVIIVKFLLNVSKSVQAQRLMDRENDTTKSWKLSLTDWKEREYWKDYRKAYEDVLSKCSHKNAPWYVIPSDKKWFRNYATAAILVEILEQYEKNWREGLEERGKIALEAIRKERQAGALNGDKHEHPDTHAPENQSDQ